MADTMSESGKFHVAITRKEVVRAAPPVQEHWLPFSNLDYLLPPLDVGAFFCYKKPSNHSNFEAMVSKLKNGMAQALVSYYAFAGEVVFNSVGEPEILCNNRGVDFAEAFADVQLEELNFYNPDVNFEGKLVPRKKNGVLAVQATELKCGGIVVSCTFDHRVADAHSTNMFLVSWAETCRSQPVTLVPCFRRSLLNSRRPVGSFDPSLDNMYIPLSSISQETPPDCIDDHHLVSRIYHVKYDELIRLQASASPNGYKGTKLESFASLLWQMIAKCSVKDENSRKKISKLGIVVDGRSKLSTEVKSKALNPSLTTYFGNVLSIASGFKKVGELVEKPLSWVTREVHGMLKNTATKDHFLDLIDWVEVNRPLAAVAKIYVTGNNDGPAFVVSSGQRFPVSKIDFGWGIPFFGSYHFPWGGTCGYVMPMPTPSDNGDWVLYMHLFKEQLEFLETQAPNVFTPLTCDHL